MAKAKTRYTRKRTKNNFDSKTMTRIKVKGKEVIRYKKKRANGLKHYYAMFCRDAAPLVRRQMGESTFNALPNKEKIAAYGRTWKIWWNNVKQNVITNYDASHPTAPFSTLSKQQQSNVMSTGWTAVWNSMKMSI